MTIHWSYIVVMAIGAVVLLAGFERIWALFGPADLGRVDFDTLKTRGSRNEFLMAPPGTTPATPHADAPVFDVSAADLRRAMEKAILSEANVERVDTNKPDGLAYVQRSQTLRFPDTIDFRFVDRPEGGSTLMAYSRSQLGRKDFGVNKARVLRWVRKAENQLKA